MLKNKGFFSHFFQWLMVFCVFLLFSTASHAKALEIKDLRIGNHKSYTRIVLDLTKSADYRLFVLQDPYRLVIDLPQLKWKAKRRSYNDVLKRKIGYIKNYRFGNFSSNVFRVVFDLSGPVKIHKYHLLKPTKTKPYRLVIDLKKTTRQKFLKSAGIKKAVGRKHSLSSLKTKKKKQPKYTKREKQKPLIVLDPGHGGIDSGAISRSGYKEKDIVLPFSKLLKAKLEATGKYRVYMTRDTDIYLKLRERTKIAQDMKAALFISIHADSAPHKPHARGASIYTLSEKASDKEAAALAKKENRSDALAGESHHHQPDEVKEILINIAQRDTMNRSSQFANITAKQLEKVTKVKDPAHRYAGFAVLKAPAIPAVLLELGYLSNKYDERLLKNHSQRRRMASAMVKAIDVYFRKQK